MVMAIQKEASKPSAHRLDGVSMLRTPRMRGLGMTVAFLSATLLAGNADAQKFDLRPTLQARLTYTDNIRASSSDRRSGWVAEISPGLAGGISREGSRVSGRFNMSLRNLGYSSDRGWRSPALGLQAAGEVEAIEDHFFVDADASIRRTNLSLFSGRASDDFLNSDRRNETRSFSIGPRLQFGLGSFANAAIRYRKTWLDGGGGTLGGQGLDQWSADLTSARAFGPLSWGLSYSRSTSAYKDEDVEDVTQESARATLFYALTQQVRLHGSVGRERNDFGGGRRESHDIVGAGFDWFPTPRTKISGAVEDRFFGNGYDLSISHRWARSSLQLSAGRDVSSSVRRFGSVFQDPFFFVLFNDPGLIALIPDPLEREEFLRQFLGLTGDSFISNSYYLDKRLRATYTIAGARNSLSFSLSRSDRSRLSSIDGLRGEDLFRDSDNVTTDAVSLSLSHRLSGRSSLNATIVRSVAERGGGLSQKTRRLTTSLGYSTSLGARSVAGLSYRHQRSDRSSSGSDFTENVLTANFGMRF
jgi:uncharacterized protein (PEP-CTERM system associated)